MANRDVEAHVSVAQMVAIDSFWSGTDPQHVTVRIFHLELQRPRLVGQTFLD
jgi:hypothetical protein